MERKSRATSKCCAAELPRDPREQDPRCGATNAPDWLNISSQSKKNAIINTNTWKRNGSAHAMKDMNCRCVTARPLIDVFATIHHRANTTTAPITSLIIHRLNALRIQEHVRAKRNVKLDRVALEERQQGEGEPFDQFYIALREIANNA